MTAPRRGKAAPPARLRRRSSGSRLNAASGYLAESERPWTSLLFVLPLVIAYGLHTSGLLHFSASAQTRTSVQQITAFVLIEELFSLFGAAGRHLPAFALVGMLLSAHLLRKDPWRLKLATIPMMLVESVIWSIPLIVMGWAIARFLPLSPNSRGDVAFMCIGAGIYEELLFRLLVVTVLSLILRDLFQMSPVWAWTTNLILSGLLFSLYHYLSPAESFQWQVFLFRTLAGIYLGLLFVVRGFGVTVGCHAGYDLFALGIFSS